MKRKFALALSFLAMAGMGTASDSQSIPGGGDSTAAGAAKVYISCPACDLDYIKTHITFVNFVRDRSEADVHILITTQSTAAGGREFTVEFIGQKSFGAMIDTLRYYSQTADTQDAIREGLAKTLKMGLVRFVARTPLADDVAVTYSKPALSTAKIDKWNYWVFSVDANTNFNGEKSRSWANYYTKLQARRTTEENRITFSIWGNYSENNYDYGTTIVKSISRGKGTNFSWTIGLGDQWSIAVGSELWSSSYGNYESVWELYPSIEYNLFPYRQSTSRQLRLAYFANLKYLDYKLETIYDKWSEWIGQQQLSVSLELVEPWGSVKSYIEATQNLPETSRNRISVGGNLSLKLVKGLSLTMDAQYARIHDQINLAKGNVSQEDVLLQRRQLATGYQYYGSIGLRYSFGSIYTNVVNPRFGG